MSDKLELVVELLNTLAESRREIEGARVWRG